jgi:hypothetical protein
LACVPDSSPIITNAIAIGLLQHLRAHSMGLLQWLCNRTFPMGPPVLHIQVIQCGRYMDRGLVEVCHVRA